MVRDKRGSWGRAFVFLALVLLLGAVTGCGARPASEVTPAATRSREGEASPVPTMTVSPPPSTATTPTQTPTQKATSTPAPLPTASLTARSTATEEVKTVTFTIVYDNNACAAAKTEDLRTAWGFGCWIVAEETTVLFDTGGDGATLLHNMGEVGLDPLDIDAVVLSHAHGDHTGGLGALLNAGARPTVYIPASFPRSFKADVRAHTHVVEVTDPTSIGPGMYTTGEVGTGIREQALAVETAEGLVVVTGCAHPGVDTMARRAWTHFGDDIALVMGGFHLGGASRARVEGIIADFRDMGVECVAPCHCTGDAARRLFKEAYGEHCTLAGVGWSTEFLLAGKD